MKTIIYLLPLLILFNCDLFKEPKTIIQKYPNDSTKVIGRVLMPDSVKDGDWTEFYPNGEVRRSMNYDHGVLDGYYRAYEENGLDYTTGQYENGKKVGNWYTVTNDSTQKLMSEYDENGERHGTQLFFIDGEIKIIEEYEHGKLVDRTML